MANCVQCGRELPSISFGELKNRCPACKFQEQQQQAMQPEAQVQSPPSLMEQARAFPVTSAILAINVAVYLACVAGSYLSHQGNAMDFTTEFVLRWGANYGPLSLDGQWWRLFTCMWLHGGLIHVGANMYCFWQIGRIAERIFGRGRYLAIYLITGIGSSLASLSWHPTTVSVGASGAIFGVAGALFVPFFHKRLRLPEPVMKSMMRNIAFFIVINLIIGASIPFIDNSAHVGGLLVGLILGEVFVRLAGAEADRESALWKVVAASVILMAAGFVAIRHYRMPVVLAAASLNALENGNQQEALEKAQRAVALRPSDALSHVALGEVYLQQSKFPEAVKEYERAHQLEPSDAEIDGRLGHAYARVADWKDAEPLLRTAVKDDDKNPGPMIDLGVALAATNRADEGLQWVRKALQIDPTSARGQFVLGTMLAGQGNYREAIQPLTEAVRLDPQNAEYKKTLEVVERAAGGAGSQ
jgi:membrane associated rhomboid family serine protease/cytochrome c-type biogenesis protein CcmH/NrfG